MWPDESIICLDDSDEETKDLTTRDGSDKAENPRVETGRARNGSGRASKENSVRKHKVPVVYEQVEKNSRHTSHTSHYHIGTSGGKRKDNIKISISKDAMKLNKNMNISISMVPNSDASGRPPAGQTTEDDVILISESDEEIVLVGKTPQQKKKKGVKSSSSRQSRSPSCESPSSMVTEFTRHQVSPSKKRPFSATESAQSTEKTKRQRGSSSSSDSSSSHPASESDEVATLSSDSSVTSAPENDIILMDHVVHAGSVMSDASTSKTCYNPKNTLGNLSTSERAALFDRNRRINKASGKKTSSHLTANNSPVTSAVGTELEERGNVSGGGTKGKWSPTLCGAPSTSERALLLRGQVPGELSSSRKSVECLSIDDECQQSKETETAECQQSKETETADCQQGKETETAGESGTCVQDQADASEIETVGGGESDRRQQAERAQDKRVPGTGRRVQLCTILNKYQMPTRNTIEPDDDAENIREANSPDDEGSYNKKTNSEKANSLEKEHSGSESNKKGDNSVVNVTTGVDTPFDRLLEAAKEKPASAGSSSGPVTSSKVKDSLDVFISTCESVLPANEFQNVFKKLAKYMNCIAPQFLYSLRLKTYIETKWALLDSDNKNVYIQIRDVLDEMKKYKQEGKGGTTSELSDSASNPREEAGNVVKRSAPPTTIPQVIRKSKTASEEAAQDGQGTDRTGSERVPKASVLGPQGKDRESSQIGDRGENSGKGGSQEMGEGAEGGEEGAKKSASRKHIKKLEKALAACGKQIKKLEETPIDFDNDDDDTYILQAKYKKRYMDIYNKLAEYNQMSADLDRRSDKKFRFGESKYPEINAKIEKFINRTKQFPDFTEIRDQVVEVNLARNLHLTDNQIHMEAEKIFQLVGRKLKKRRGGDDFDSLYSYLEEAVDPATQDQELANQLDIQGQMARQKIDRVFEEFVEKQAVLKRDSANEATEEDECNDDEDTARAAGDNSEASDTEQEPITSSQFSCDDPELGDAGSNLDGEVEGGLDGGHETEPEDGESLGSEDTEDSECEDGEEDGNISNSYS